MSTASSWFDPLVLKFPVLARVAAVPRPLLLAALAALLSFVIVLALWSRDPDYKVLFSNLQDRDGGAIVTALTQLNVPYRFNDNGTAILVPASKVYEARLQLASQGLPRSGNAGFELLDTPRFGASQFAEQISYQRALEGELARSIEALNPVQSARVHLAMPRQSLFVRERQMPTASVLVNVYSGRVLSDAQVAAISWLLSSSVAELRAENVSVVDQTGRLLSAPRGDGRGMDADQTRHIRDVEQRTVERILAILTPLVGAGNVHAQVNADVDFAQREETAERYRPNQEPGQAAMRSQQVSDSRTGAGNAAQGVPGALSNQPPANAQAPIVAPAQNGNAATATGTGAAPAAANASGASGTLRSDSTTNFELDRTISHTRQSVGNIKRLSVAVVVNHRLNAQGQAEALPAELVTQLNELTRQAMGFSAERGDSLNVVNSAFTDSSTAEPWWQDAQLREWGASLLYGMGVLLLAMLLWRKLWRPIWYRYIDPPVDPALAEAQRVESQRRAVETARASAQTRFDENLARARELAAKDPRAVAMVLRTWMGQDEK